MEGMFSLDVASRQMIRLMPTTYSMVYVLYEEIQFQF